MATMKQEYMPEAHVIKFRDVEIPVVRPGTVKVKMLKMGICGSEMHVYHGKHPFTSYPIVQGHEVSCEIVEVGEGVTKFKAGDFVTVVPQVICGECLQCKTGKYNICDTLKVLGFQADGLAQEYFVIDEDWVLPLPDSISRDEGAMIEPLAVAVHAIARYGDVKGKKVAVLGSGTIGNLVAQVAKAQGATVLSADISDFRLNLLKNECGIDYVVNTRNENLGEALLKAFGPDKADVILDCAGVQVTLDSAIDLARKGSPIIIVAVFEDKPTVDMGLIQDRELDLRGILMYKKEDWLESIKLVGESRVNLKPLITSHFKFEQMKEACEFIDKEGDKCLKVILDF